MPEVETGLSGRALALREVFQANKAEIHSVTVYRDRAEVKRSVRVRLDTEAENEIVVSGLPACTDKNSIRLLPHNLCLYQRMSFQWNSSLCVSYDPCYPLFVFA